MLSAEGNADDGDEKQDAQKEMAHGKPDAPDKEPQYIHECVEAAGRLAGVAYFFAEGPKGE